MVTTVVKTKIIVTEVVQVGSSLGFVGKDEKGITRWYRVLQPSLFHAIQPGAELDAIVEIQAVSPMETLRIVRQLRGIQ